MLTICLCDIVLAFFFFLKVLLLSSLPTFISSYYIKITNKLDNCVMEARLVDRLFTLDVIWF